MCSLAAVAKVLRAGAGATKHPKAVCSSLLVFLFFLCFLPPHCPQSTLGLLSAWLSVSESDLKGARPAGKGEHDRDGVSETGCQEGLCVMEGAQHHGCLRGGPSPVWEPGELLRWQLNGDPEKSKYCLGGQKYPRSLGKGTPVPSFILSPAPHFPHM